MEQQKTAVGKGVFSKWRLLWILIAAAWLFVILKLVAGSFFEKNTSLVAAFTVTNPTELSATVEITARCPEWQEGDGERLLEQLAASIGLRLDGTEKRETLTTEQRQETCITKEAKAATTEMRIIRLHGTDGEESVKKDYVYAKIELKEALDTVLAYKVLIEYTLEKLSCTEISTTIQLMGDYAGYLTLDKRDEITEKILRALEAEVVYEYREADLYTVYAYTASLENYITVENKRINLHIAMSQDEENYRTILYLASPVLPDTW